MSQTERQGNASNFFPFKHCAQAPINIESIYIL